MPRRIIEFYEPDRFSTGSLGEPGEGTFYLQAVKGEHVASVALEKEQVAILADRLLIVVDELERRGLAAIEATAAALDERPLDQPLLEEFQVGTLTIAWDDDVDRLVVEARSRTFDGAGESAAPEAADSVDDEDEIPDDAPIGPDVLRVRLTPFMAQQFARRAGRVVAGVPLCPFCGEPLRPTGHHCPRRSGSEPVH